GRPGPGCGCGAGARLARRAGERRGRGRQAPGEDGRGDAARGQRGAQGVFGRAQAQAHARPRLEPDPRVDRVAIVRLLAITPPASVAPRLDPGLVDAWIRGGALELGIAVLLREPGAELQATLGDPRFAALRVALDDRGIPTLVSAAADAIDEQTAELLIAARPALAGVQLRGDPSVADTQRARDLLGSRMIGRSCHGQTPDPVAHAVDYTCLAPVFAPRTAQPGRPKQAI